MSTTSNRQYRNHVILWFLLVAGLVLVFSGYIIYYNADSFLTQKLKNQQLVLTESIASLIDGTIHRTYRSKKHMQLSSYRHYNQALLKAVEIDELSSTIYTLNLSKQNKLTYGLLSNIKNIYLQEFAKTIVTGSELLDEKLGLKIKEFYHDGKLSKSQVKLNRHKPKRVSLAIIRDEQQNPAGILVIEVPFKPLEIFSENLYKSVLFTTFILFLVLIAAAVIFAHKITRPFGQLTNAIERLIKNDFNFKLSRSGLGGFGYIAQQFNLMLKKIQASRDELEATNRAYSRFVPHSVLKLISPGGIKAAKLGDCIEKEMSILFCDIRDFTQLSESMSPHDNFKFINRYLNIVVPVINKYGGIVDKYMGDGIMVLFPNSADHALSAAVGMLNALDIYNEKLSAANLPPIKIGLGLHTGKMMLGTVGTSSRMDVTAISDTVNAAARIEALTKTFKAKILISAQFKAMLLKFDQQGIRFIATCAIKGKAQPMTVYEVFSNDSFSRQKEKRRNQKGMLKAWQLYKDGDVDAAVYQYQKLMENYSMDDAILALIEVVQRGRL